MYFCATLHILFKKVNVTGLFTFLSCNVLPNTFIIFSLFLSVKSNVWITSISHVYLNHLVSVRQRYKKVV